MLLPSVFNDNLFRDLFDDDFYMPMMPDMSDVDKKLYGGRAAHEMKTDVKETEKGYEVAVDLPGFKKDDVTVELNDGYMTITAAKKVVGDKKNDEGKYIRREHYAGTMSRTFYVGDQLTENDIHAQMNDGILTLQIPKMEEKKQVEDKRHLIQIDAA